MINCDLQLETIVNYLDDYLEIRKIPDKFAKNGLIVSTDKSIRIKKIAFAVDSNLDTFNLSYESGANLLVVHHGLFLGNPLEVTNYDSERIKYLVEHNMSLYGAHIPLDIHPEVGNNAVLAKMIGARKIGSFSYGLYADIPDKRSLKSIKDIFDKEYEYDSKLILPKNISDRQEIENVLISSGSGESILRHFLNWPNFQYSDFERRFIPDYLTSDIKKPDLFITGEQNHMLYSMAMDYAVPILFIGHYNSEKGGIEALRVKTESVFGIETQFIEKNSGL